MFLLISYYIFGLIIVVYGGRVRTIGEFFGAFLWALIWPIVLIVGFRPGTEETSL